MNNANVRVLVIVFALIALVAGAGMFVSTMQPQDAPPVVSERVSITPAIPEKTEQTQAYLRVQVGDEVWPLIPLTEGGEYTVSQSDSGARNVIHTTASSALMHFSTCDNQNCVQQGEVSLANRDLRVMGNLIVCLPNEVVLELLDPKEVN